MIQIAVCDDEPLLNVDCRLISNQNRMERFLLKDVLYIMRDKI